MTLRRLAAAALLCALAACSKPSEPQAPDAAPPAAAPTSPAPEPAAPPAAGSGETPAPNPPPAPEPPPQAATSPVPAPVAAVKSASPAPGGSPIDELKAGEDYVRIADGEPFDTPPGKIEVAEVFNYICPACNAFRPAFEAWAAKLPSDVHLVYVPAEFRPDFKTYAQAYFAAQSLGLVEKTHDAVYEAIHETHELPGEGMRVDTAKVAAFYAKYGADPQEFQQLMESFTVNAQVGKAHQFTLASQVRSTPSLVIDGKYLVKGKSWENVLDNASTLIAEARAH